MTAPSPDAQAIVRICEQLTTQVQRIANALQTPAAVIRDGVLTPLNGDTTAPAETCEHRGPHPGFSCAEADASQPYFRVRWEQEQQAPAEEDDATCRRMETRTCPPSYNGPCGERPCARFESDDPGPWLVPAEDRAERLAALLAVILDNDSDLLPAHRVTQIEAYLSPDHGQHCHAPTPRADLVGVWAPEPPIGCLLPTQAAPAPPAEAAVDEDALRSNRRDSLRVLFSRAQGGLTPDEAKLLVDQAETEMREADTARSVAAGNRRHVQLMYADLEQANEAARRALQQRQEMAEERHALQEQRDTAERVRSVVRLWAPKLLPRSEAYRLLTDLRVALDGREQPTPRQPSYTELRAAYDESWQLIDMQKDFLGNLRRIILTATSDREDENLRAERCERCGRDHMAELYDAIVTADKRYAEVFPATADGPARPGRLPNRPDTTRLEHLGDGANAEDCPACSGTNPPYPFTCPGQQPARTEGQS